jgi:hypothetical protein
MATKIGDVCADKPSLEPNAPPSAVAFGGSLERDLVEPQGGSGGEHEPVHSMYEPGCL